MNYILDADTSYRIVSQYAGGKASNLARMTQLAFPVPLWFVVSVEAYDEFIRSNSLQEAIHPNDNFLKFSKKVESLFLSAVVPDGIKDQICQKLSQFKLNNAFVAVRSSGLEEDSAENSFAGQFSSFLFQKGWEQIEHSLKKCWASGFSERVLNYLADRGLGLSNIRMGVVIQKMVNAESAGVVFSRNPIRVRNRDEILISSVWGLGEGLVSGELESDDVNINRITHAITKNIVKKEHAFHQASNCDLIKIAIDPELKLSPSLNDSQIKEVAQLSVKLEESLGAPQDSEFAYEDGSLYVVQSRPITNLPPSTFYDHKVKGIKPTLWDNSNIIESYGGVTSPLTFSFASRAYNQVYIQFCELMGVPKKVVDRKADVFRNMLGFIRGRIYYNLVSWYQLVLMLPGSLSNKSFMETMMGVKQRIGPEMAGIFDFVKSPPRYSLWAKAKLFCRAVLRFIRMNNIVSSFNQHFNAVYNDARKKDFKNLSLSEQIDYYHYLEEKLLKQWKAPIINDYFCMLFFGLLKALTEKWVSSKGEVVESLQNDLLCGEGGIESTEPTKFLMRIAEKIENGEYSFRQWFLDTPPAEVWKELKTFKPDTAIANLFHEFIDKFGFRCVNELKLEEPDMHDDPDFVINLVASYVRTGAYSISCMERRERDIRNRAEEKVKEKVSGLKKIIYYWALRQTRKAVKNRENLRFARTKVFGISRHLFRAIGGNLEALGLVEKERDIFFLTVDEIIAFTEGRALQDDLKGIITHRRKAFTAFKKTTPPPDRFIIHGAVGASLLYPSFLAEGDLSGGEDASCGPNILNGTPCCPGIVEGTVRVIENLKDAMGLNGEILVAARTDPGWVPLYPSCSGLLIERGSLLSHSAIAAREFGLPTIVGVSGGLMARLKTGDRVRIDAGKGQIRIVE